MKILVVGSGLIGLTSAYALARRGAQVTLLERNEDVALGASFANGGLLTPSMSDPWNAPGCWRVLLGSLGRQDAVMQLRWSQAPKLAGWGPAFLWNSRPSAYRANTRRNLQLARYSLEHLERIRPHLAPFGYRGEGSLRVFRDEPALAAALAAAEAMLGPGAFRPLNRAELLAFEPGLGPIGPELVGGIHYPEDAVGDARRFCDAVRQEAAALGVAISFGAAAERVVLAGDEAQGVQVAGEVLQADAYVLAAGSWTPGLLPRPLRPPVRPAKGYSVTFDLPDGVRPLRRPILDDRLHAVVTPLEGCLRVAGTAEFAGFDNRLPAARIANLTRLLREMLPELDLDLHAGRPWAGLRPMSVDGVPIIGRTAARNLYLNTGHGHLGWTMAVGSAELLAQLISHDAPGIDSADYAPSRFHGE